MLDPQDLIAMTMWFIWVQRSELAPDHHSDDVIFIHPAGVAGANMLAVTYYADSVGDSFNFIELVRNINTGDAVVLQIANNCQQRRGFLFG